MNSLKVASSDLANPARPPLAGIMLATVLAGACAAKAPSPEFPSTTVVQDGRLPSPEEIVHAVQKQLAEGVLCEEKGHHVSYGNFGKGANLSTLTAISCPQPVQTTIEDPLPGESLSTMRTTGGTAHFIVRLTCEEPTLVLREDGFPRASHCKSVESDVNHWVGAGESQLFLLPPEIFATDSSVQPPEPLIHIASPYFTQLRDVAALQLQEDPKELHWSFSWNGDRDDSLFLHFYSRKDQVPNHSRSFHCRDLAFKVVGDTLWVNSKPCKESR